MKINVLNIAVVILILLGSIGWIKNIVHLCQCDFEPSYKAEAIYSIGLVTGTSCILGWFDFGK